MENKKRKKTKKKNENFLDEKIRAGNSEFVFLSKLKDRDGKQLEENRGNFMAAARLEDIRFPVKGERERIRERERRYIFQTFNSSTRLCIFLGEKTDFLNSPEKFQIVS